MHRSSVNDLKRVLFITLSLRIQYLEFAVHEKKSFLVIQVTTVHEK